MYFSICFGNSFKIHQIYNTLQLLYYREKFKSMKEHIKKIMKHTGMFSVFPNAVIREDQNPRTPLGRWLGDIAIESRNRTSDMWRTLYFQVILINNSKKAVHKKSQRKPYNKMDYAPNLNNWINWNSSTFSIL